MADADGPLNRAYIFLTGDDDEARACREIPDEACEAAPRSFVLNVANGTCTKLAEQLASPGLVLPWLLTSIGAPAALTGWLVPMKQVGSLLPQLLVAGYLRGFARRKWFWFAAGAIQAAMLVMMMLAAVLLPATSAGIAIVGLLLLFSIASGVGSVAFSDVVGKTVPRGRRGRMLGLRATLGGVLALGAGVALRQTMGEDADVTPFAVLLIIAAGLWLAAAILFALIPEPHGSTEGGENAIDRAVAGLGLVRRDPTFRRFIIARILMLSVELAMPYFVLHARGFESIGGGDLGVFVIAVSLAAVVSSPIWGRFADLAAQKVMAIAGLVGAVAVGLALLFAVLPPDTQAPWVYAIVFAVLGLAEGGVRLGRKTYLVDVAPANEKGTYKAVANTLTGVVVLAAGGLGFIADATGAAALLVGLGAVMAVAAILSWTLPDDEEAKSSDG